ncbi:hypothetical protein GCM10010211_51990 [Streptomyces albospinus]|uniref:Uncharacterized protein n=1 Tax=Streptomyces albospinus TaxID=285515 RepID=A0ABQ2VEP7_9ACTN|nr:hypothetical protein GCM10010211_51990 [Streptomyces albospinus]
MTVPALDFLPAFRQPTGKSEHETRCSPEAIQHVQSQMPAAGLDATHPQAGDPGQVVAAARCGSCGQQTTQAVLGEGVPLLADVGIEVQGEGGAGASLDLS